MSGNARGYCEFQKAMQISQEKLQIFLWAKKEFLSIP
jgi:hypothetical protein